MSQQISSLQSLTFSENVISEIEENAFEGLSSLRTLNLNRNNILDWTPESFNGLEHLLTLSFQRKPLGEIPRNGFGQLKALQSLDCGVFQVKPLRRSMKILFQRTLTIFLQVQELLAGVFVPLRNLLQLLLSFNRIQRLNSDAFGLLENIHTIHFDDNSTNEIKPIFFENLPSLTLFNGLRNECIERNVK